MTAPKIHRFLIAHIPENNTITDTRIVHQAYAVLRLQAGESIVLFEDGGNDVLCTIREITKNTMTIEKIRTIPVAQPPRTLIAAVAIIKGDRFEMVVQKLTEIGVSDIVPIITARTIKQSVRIDRLQTISDEALEQCGGTRRIKIHEPLDLPSCVKKWDVPAYVLAPDGTTSTAVPETCIMYIGPEGGWAPEDEVLLASMNAQMLSLGPRILRTETAAIIGSYTLLWA